MASYKVGKPEFSSRYGILSVAVVKAAVRRGLTADERVEMDKLARILGYKGRGLTLGEYVPKSMTVCDEKLGVAYMVQYDENYIAVDEVLNLDLELKLYVIYFVRSLPLHEFEEDYEYEQRALAGEYVGGGDAYGDIATLMPGFAKFLESDGELESSDDEFVDAQEGISPVFPKTLGRVVEKEGKRYHEISIEELESVSCVQRHKKAFEKEVYFSVKPDKGVDVPVVGTYRTTSKYLDGSLMFQGPASVVHYGLFSNQDSIVTGITDYQNALLASNTDEISLEQRRMILLGEAFMSLVYVTNRVRQGWTVEEIARGKCIDLSTSAVTAAADKFFKKTNSAYLRVGGSLKNRLRWYVASLLVGSENKAVAELSLIFPDWLTCDYRCFDWDKLSGRFTEAVLERGNWSEFIGSSKVNAWFFGALAEFGDALLTYWLYYVLVRSKGVTPAEMQESRSKFLSNEYLSDSAKSQGITSLTVHENGDKYEACSALIFLKFGSERFDYYSRNSLGYSELGKRFVADKCVSIYCNS